MRYSETPTDHIVVRVNTNSDHDTIDFGIVHLTQQFKKTISDRRILTSYFATDPTFNHAEFSDGSITFYNWNEENEDLDYIRELLEEDESIYVTIDPDFDFEYSFTRPKQRLDTFSLRMGTVGAFNYVCFDNDNGDEYYTGGIIL